MRGITLSAFALALAACVSAPERNWIGSGATAFDAARAKCEPITQRAGPTAYDACMAAEGWTRK